MRARRRRSHGFTLIEALVASFIFMFGLIGLLGALIQARGATTQARREMRANAIAMDMVEQLRLWRFDDPRLAVSTGVCATDPADEAGALDDPTSGAYTTYVDCMHDEADLTANGAEWGGLPSPSFTENGSTDTYERYYIVRDETVRAGVLRRYIWVKVLYREGGTVRVVSADTLRVQMGGM